MNACQILMPSAFFPELTGIPIYKTLLFCCLAASFPRVLAQLSGPTLVERPISVCVLGLLLAVAMSWLSQLKITYAKDASLDFSKLVIYYLVLVANVDSPARLR